MKKHYVPQIDEFGINFEYEVRVDGKWSSRTLHHTTSLHNILVELQKGNIRVRYLDEEDLCNLGWKKQGFWYNLNDYSLNYGKPFIDHGVVVTKVKKSEEHGFIYFFRGFIKNISELTKLMKQLNIE